MSGKSKVKYYRVIICNKIKRLLNFITKPNITQITIVFAKIYVTQPEISSFIYALSRAQKQSHDMDQIPYTMLLIFFNRK